MMPTKPKTQQKLSDAELEKILNSPTLFVMNIIGATPTRYQAEFLESTASRIILLAGRRVGKSTMIAWKAIWTAFVKPEQEILLIAPSFRQAQVIYQMIYDIVSSNEFIRSHTTKLNMAELRFDNKSVIRNFTAGKTGEYVRGYGASMLIFDEAGMIPDMVFGAIEPSMAVRGETLILSGTPYGKRGRFWQAYDDATGPFNNGKWTVFKIRSTESPIVSQEFLAEERTRLTAAEFAQEYEVEWVDEVGRYFPLELVFSSTEDYEYKLYNDDTYKYYMGVDVSHMGLDETAIVIIAKNEDIYKVVYAQSLSKVDLIQTAGRIVEILRTMHINKIMVDNIGVGAGLVDILKKQTSDNIVPVTLEGKRRLEAYSKIKAFLEQKRLTLSRGDTKFLYQFSNYTSEYTSSGDLRVIKDVKGHDDLVDALTLAVFGADVTYSVTPIMDELNDVMRYNTGAIMNDLATINRRYPNDPYRQPRGGSPI